VDEIMTDENGRFTFRAVEGIDYGLTTIVGVQPILPFSFRKAGEPIILVHDASREPKDLPY
jgi:hypothetical protein